MKKGKKLLIALGMVVAAVAIAAGSIAGTVAYMTSASKVSNVFTIGNVKIHMDEGKVDADGKLLTGSEAARTDSNSYLLMPGKSYDKDPLITVQADTQACYLFLVTRNQISSIEVQNDPYKPTMAQQMVANGWGIYKDTTAGTRVWIYCGKNTAGQNDRIGADMKAIKPVAICGSGVTTADATQVTTLPVFTNFYITTTESDNLAIYSGAEVTLNAVGIQADSFGELGNMTSVNAAWAAVVNQFPYIQDNVGTETEAPAQNG